jgi:hypothetical protein
MDTYKTYYLITSLVDLFSLVLYYPLAEIQVVIVISTQVIITSLVFISLIPFPFKPTLPVLFPNIFFPAILVNLIILSRKLRYYRDYYLKLLY